MPRTSEQAAADDVVGHLLTVEQAADYLNVSPRWLSDAVRQRRIRCARLGRRVRFRIEYLEEFIAASEQPVTAAPGAPSVRALPALRRPGGARSRL